LSPECCFDLATGMPIARNGKPSIFQRSGEITQVTQLPIEAA